MRGAPCTGRMTMDIDSLRARDVAPSTLRREGKSSGRLKVERMGGIPFSII